MQTAEILWLAALSLTQSNASAIAWKLPEPVLSKKLFVDVRR
jgi:hypothetical protein